MTMKIIAIVTAALLAAAIPGAAEAAEPQAREDDDKFVLENDFVRVWFQGKKPMLKVFPANASEDDNESSFFYKFTDLVEYRDVDSDGAPSQNEVLASLNLDKASAWTVNTSEEGDAVVLNLSMDAPVKLGRSNLTDNVSVPERDASISLVFTIRSGASTINASGENVTVPATSIKYDLYVHSWPFVNAELGRLALETKVTGDLDYDNATNSANVSTNGTSVGALSWTSNATGVTTDGENVTVPVRTAITQGLDNETAITYTYDAADLASLLHDPTVGTTTTPESLEESAGDDDKRVPMPGVLLLVAVVAAAALVIRRR